MKKSQSSPKPTKQLLKQLLLGYLALRPRSVHECRQYLKKKQSSLEIEEEIIAEFVELKLLDDLEFSKWLVESRMRTKPRGQLLLKQDLRQHGIDDHLIGIVLNQFDQQSLVDAAVVVLEKKAYKYLKFSGYQQKAKLYQLLARRGFASSVINTAIDAWQSKQ